MNHLYLCALSFVFTIAVVPFASAQKIEDEFDPFDPESTPYSREHWPALIKMDYRAYDVPLNIADDLMRKRKFEGHDDKLLDTLSSNEQVQLIDLATVTGRPGDTMMVENITEIIYETEYEPPTANEDDEEAEQSADTKATLEALATPTAFEAKNSGLTLELEPSLSDGDNIVDFRFAYEHNTLLRFEPIVKSKDSAEKFPFSSPVFYTQRLNISQTVGSGHSILTGITIPLNDQKKPSKTHRRFLFMTVTVDRVKPIHNP